MEPYLTEFCGIYRHAERFRAYRRRELIHFFEKEERKSSYREFSFSLDNAFKDLTSFPGVTDYTSLLE